MKPRCQQEKESTADQGGPARQREAGSEGYETSLPLPHCPAFAELRALLGVLRFCAPFWDTRLNPAGDSDERTETATTGTFNVAYQFTPELNSYASYSRGYKSGGYNFDRAGFTTPATPKVVRCVTAEM